jgi:transposase
MTAREKELTGLLEQCQQALVESRRENEFLRQKIDLLIKRVFGSSSEQLDRNQLELLLAEQPPASVPPLTKEVAPASSRPRKATVRKDRLPEHLPVVEEVLDPEPVKAQPEQWRCIGQEVSEQLDYEPGRFLRRRLIRRKYVHRTQTDEAPIIAALPERLLNRSLPAPGLLAHVLVSKYCDHLPLYRQEQIYRQRYGVDLSRQTLAGWVELAAGWLQLVYDSIRTGVLAGGYVQVDETPVEYLEPGHGRTRQGYLWTCHRPGADVLFHWETSRSGSCLDNLIPVDFTGTLQCDGYGAYRSFSGRRTGIELAGCWAHVRRKFYEAKESQRRTAGWLLGQIQVLYQVEARLRDQRAGPRLRQAVRAAESLPVIRRLEQALWRLKAKGRLLPKSPLRQAIDYALGQWPALEVYLGDGRVEIDNNLVENAIRPTAIGKKNWLFIGEAQAGHRSAVIYTIIESCKRRGLEPYAYLKDVLTRLPSMTNHQVKDITPSAMAAANKQTLLQAAS